MVKSIYGLEITASRFYGGLVRTFVQYEYAGGISGNGMGQASQGVHSVK